MPTNLNAHLAEGTITAVAGPSGGGKTTPPRLIARFRDADAVRTGGTDMRDIPTGELTNRLTIVFEDAHLFDGTIKENRVFR